MAGREELLKAGKGEIRVFRSGMYQREDFSVKRIDSPFGKYVVLEVDKIIDVKELVRVAEEYQLPVCAKNGKVFPRGKSVKDFVGL
jgi:hypothetical protein